MLLFLFLSAFLAVAHSHEGCGAAHPGKHEMEVDAILMRSVHHRQDRRRLLGKSCEELCTRCIEVPTYFHFLALPLDGGDFLLPHPTNAYRQVQQEMQRGGQVTVDPNDFTSYEEMLTLVDYQMAILNQRTKDTPFRFTLMDRNETTVSTNPDFVFEAESRSGEISAALSKGDGLSSLNVYLAPSLNGLGDTVNGVTLGFATFPSNQLQQLGDGIFLRYDVMARGGFERRDKGITLVHEVSSWNGVICRALTDRNCLGRPLAWLASCVRGFSHSKWNGSIRSLCGIQHQRFGGRYASHGRTLPEHIRLFGFHGSLLLVARYVSQSAWIRPCLQLDELPARRGVLRGRGRIHLWSNGTHVQAMDSIS